MAVDTSTLSQEQINSIIHQRAMEEPRLAAQKEQEMIRVRSDAVRMARDTLAENKRNLPADQREITAADITAFAATLITYIGSTEA